MNGPLPPLPYDAWRETLQTLHRCTQIVGKVQLALTPRQNHFWNVAFQVAPSGLRTPAIPVMANGGRTFSVELDFVDHNVVVRTSDDEVRLLALVPRPVADFYRDFMQMLGSLEIDVSIRDNPVEIPDPPIAFRDDRQHAAYDAKAVERWWRTLSWTAQVFEEFRTRYVGKQSPVQFWWGSFDLSVSRYSGRPAPIKPEADTIQRESYSHEVSSAGFWPGDSRYPAPAFYAYTVPAPPGLSGAPVQPEAAFWNNDLGEFLLPYDAIRESDAPDRLLLDFMQTAYEAGASAAGWDRPALERGSGQPTPPRSEDRELASHPAPA
jgi:hypothetical protein